MFHQNIKSLFSSSVSSIVSNIDQYTTNPEKDLTRNKKLPADKRDHWKSDLKITRN